MIRDKQLAKWIKANPWILVNVRSIGTMCGRFPTREAAEEHVRRNQFATLVGVEGRNVLFGEPVYL